MEITEQEIQGVFNRTLEYIKQGWTKHTMAINVDGDYTDFDAPDACNWCLEGALHLAVKECGNEIDTSSIYLSCHSRIVAVINDLYPKRFPSDIETLAIFNDNAEITKELVVDVVKRAIESELPTLDNSMES